MLVRTPTLTFKANKQDTCIKQNITVNVMPPLIMANQFSFKELCNGVMTHTIPWTVSTFLNGKKGCTSTILSGVLSPKNPVNIFQKI